MAWTKLRYSAAQIDVAGDVLAKNQQSTVLESALDVVNNWRSCHGFPLNTFQQTLRRKARAVDESATVAQRIKRLPAIQHKLERLRHLRLSQLQDIGGCRAIVSDLSGVKRLRDDYVIGSNIRHVRLTENDYLAAPKKSGYRGIHLVYEYVSDRNGDHNGRKIEVQLRSRLQHAWATAVETVGMFSGEYLKSSRGDKQWLRFFALMGSVMAMRENAPLVPGTPNVMAELLAELKSHADSIDAKRRLVAYGATLRYAEPSKGSYFLLKLTAATEQLEITGYNINQLAQANADYLALERSIMGNPGADAVLVSVDSVRSLRAAYPNYYLDTQLFVQALDAALKSGTKSA